MWETFWGILGALSQQLAAWALVAVTVAAAGASVWVAVLAHKNGKRATEVSAASVRISEDSVKIAREAAEREEARIESEHLRQVEEAQERVSLAILRAINAVDYSEAVRGGSEFSEAKRQKDSMLIDAAALIDLHSNSGSNSELRVWFATSTKELGRIAKSSGRSSSEYLRYRASLIKNVGLWNRNAMTTLQLRETLKPRPTQH